MIRCFLVFFLICIKIYSQNIQDAFDLSYEYNSLGSSRYNSLGGAMGALGQDLSSININPASGSISENSYIGISINNSFISDNSHFYDIKKRNGDYELNLSQAGILLIKKFEESSTKFKSLSLGVNYNIRKNLLQNIDITEVKTDNSIIQSFVKNANYFDYQGTGQIDEVEGLAQHLGIIKFDDKRPSNNKFYTDITDFNNHKSVNILKQGIIGEYSIAGSFNYDELLFLGISYIHNTLRQYNKDINIYEKEYNLSYNQNLITNGYGNGFSIGLIIKPTYFVRLGYSYKTSIKYNLTDLYTYRLNGLQDDNYQYNYNFYSPSIMTFSGAFILGQIGLLSFDYEKKDYRNMSFFNENFDDFGDVNDNIKLNGNDSYNLRIGSEFRWLIFRVRTGFSYTSSPRKDIDISNYRLTFGLGMIINEYDFDISYGYLNVKNQNFIYDKEIVSPILINSNHNFITISFNYHFLN